MLPKTTNFKKNVPQMVFGIQFTVSTVSSILQVNFGIATNIRLNSIMRGERSRDKTKIKIKFIDRKLLIFFSSAQFKCSISFSLHQGNENYLRYWAMEGARHFFFHVPHHSPLLGIISLCACWKRVELALKRKNQRQKQKAKERDQHRKKEAWNQNNGKIRWSFRC